MRVKVYLYTSQIDKKDLLDVLEVLLIAHVHYIVFNNLFIPFNMCVKFMFLNIPDSVMNSHI